MLIPEVPFDLDGLLAHVRGLVADCGHAVLVVAEDAGQEHLPEAPAGADASGNARLGAIERLAAGPLRPHPDPGGHQPPLNGNPDGDLWLSVLESTGRPARFRAPAAAQWPPARRTRRTAPAPVWR